MANPDLTHAVTARQLRDTLATLPDDTIVVLAKDAEGNAFTICARTEQAGYHAETPWSGFLADPDAASDEGGWAYDPARDDGTPCVVLWPH